MSYQHELESTLLKGGYIVDYIGEYDRGLLRGMLGVLIMALTA